MADGGTGPVLAATIWDFHPETFCAHEYLLRRDYRNALREAAERMVQRASEMADDRGEVRLARLTGAQLIDGMFLMQQQGPLAKFGFNLLEDRNSRTEHRGLTDLMRGAVNALRNPLSHRHARQFTEQEAYEWLALISVLHRRLDDVRYIGPSQPPDY